MRRWLLLTAVGLALAGCKNLDREKTPGAPASRPKNWAEGPNPGLGRVGTPDADSWSDPKDPGYDLDREMRGVLAGFVEDPDGRKLRDVFIEVEPVGADKSGAPVGVQTDRSGHFLIKGLKPKQAYQLTVQTKLDGREVGGQVYARTGSDKSQFVRVSLVEGLSFPNRPVTTAGGRDRPDPPGAAPSLPSGTPAPRTGTGLALPPSSDARVGEPPARPDLSTKTADPIGRPPAANIPGPSVPTPSVTPGPSRSVNSRSEFLLVDSTGASRAFPAGRAGELVLLDFMTTTCLPCKRANPTIKGLQARYGTRGLEVVGVTCDDVGVPERRALASRYQRTEGLNYLLYVEPGAEPGAVARRFGVKAFPTLVLLGGSGDVLWTGHPSDAGELERVIERELARR
jgi:thiol-disulfide isomerase/thioredoxin